MQRIKGYSIPKQLREIAEAAQRDGAPIPEGNLLGDADSGRKFERQGLQTLLARARERRVSTVYFSKVDRIGRNARDSLNIVHELSSLGVRIIVLEPRLDTKDPFGYFLFVILAAMAELEATFSLERTMGGKLEKLAMDSENEMPAPPPGRYSRYGYQYIAPPKKGQRGHDEPNPEQSRWVRWIFMRCADSMTPDAIATALNAQRVPAPQGEYWWDGTVRSIVRCRAYLGEMTRKMGQQTFVFPVEPLVNRELWLAANAAIDNNKRLARRNAKAEYLLASSRERPLLRCRLCHREGIEHHMGGRTRADRPQLGKRGEYYECVHRVQGRRVFHRVPATLLEDAVWEALRALVADEERILSRVDRLSAAADQEMREMSERLAALQDAEQQNRLAQARLIEVATRGRLAHDLIAQQEEDLAREAESLAAERTRLEAHLSQVREGQAPIHQVRNACALLKDGMLEAGPAEKKYLINLNGSSAAARCRRHCARQDQYERVGQLPLSLLLEWLVWPERASA
jgi:site-specific DNA recombinase